MALPPSLTGAVQDRDTCVEPLTARSSCGEVGTVRTLPAVTDPGVALGTSADSGDTR